MIDLSQAIQLYHDLLAACAPESQALLEQRIHERRLTFGDRPVCSVLRPFFLDTETYRYVHAQSGLVLSAIARLGQALLAEPDLRCELDLTPEEEQIIAIDPGYPGPDASSRLDAFLVNGEAGAPADFKFVEYNAESPGGLAFGDLLGEVFLELPVMAQFRKGYGLRTFPTRQMVLDALMGSYRDWGGRNHPRIAIVDWREVRTFNEFLMMQELFQSQGYDVLICDPRDLEYSRGRLRTGDFEIDLVYKRVVTGELLERGGLDHPLIRAAADRAVCVVNSFQTQMLFKKVLFAMISDPAYRQMFTPEQRGAIDDHIPWTRKVCDGYTTYQDRPIDLVRFVQDNRMALVLKPNGEYGGKGVILGWECDQTTWESALSDALAGSYVVQERVQVRRETFPVWVDGQLIYDERLADLDPYVWRGRDIKGCGVRLSTSALLNVSAGGGSAVPLVLLEKDLA